MHTDKAILRGRVGRVFALLDELTEALPVPPTHKELLQVHLRIGKEQAWAWPEMSAIQLPLLVHKGITGDERPALPIATACTFLGLGADLLDSILDRELPPLWYTRAPAEAALAATTLLAALPQVSIAGLREVETSRAKLWTLAYLFADTVLTLNAGQHEDMLLPSLENVSLDDCRSMVERKSGAANSLFARAGAVLATEDTFTIEAYAAFGSCFGVAKQLINDVWDIWGQGVSQDLVNGKRTLPIVHALSTLRGEQRERLRKLLLAARESAEHHDEVRALLATAGSVRYTALIVWLYQQRARKHLASASPQESAGRELQMLLNRASLLPQPREAQATD